MDQNKADKSIQKTEDQNNVFLRDTRRRFIKALIFNIVYTINWTIIGLFIPEGNWLGIYNVVLALISFWIFSSFYQPFYKARIHIVWISYLLAAITWFAITLAFINLINWLLK